MEDNEEYEVSRLKKLLEDQILQAEKENMAILQGSAETPKDFVHPIKRNVKSCPHIKSSQSVKQDWSGVNSRNIHSRIHFLKDLESSLLPSEDKRRILMDCSRNRYIPCAIPLSPPVRLKSNTSEERMHSTSNIHTHESELLVPNHIHNQSPKQHFAMIEKCFPSTSVCDKKQSTSTANERKEFIEVNKTLLVHKEEDSVRIRSPTNSYLSSKKLKFSPTEEIIPKSKPIENFSHAVDGEKQGFHLQISLDSCSAKDVISQMLHKIPELVNKVQAPSNNSITNASSSSEQMGKQDKLSQTFDSESIRNVSKNSTKLNQMTSSSVQTDENKEELHIKKHELHHLVKDIVLETLQNMELCKQIPFKAAYTSTCQKVDSGIQSEVESDIADCGRNFKMNFPDKGVILNQENDVPVRDYFSVSKGVQVDLYPVQNAKSPNVNDKSCNTDNPGYLLQTDEDNNKQASVKQLKNGNSLSDRNSSPVQEPNKIESMLEKIYDHIFQEKEASRTSNDISPNNPILTRDVAVQFNPLHTSTKSTLTSEVKRADSSCQYDIRFKEALIQKPTVNASVQAVVTEPCNDHHLQINAYTQYEQKSFIDSVAQTELLLNSEHSATNTSVSSTPVSDNMFMDDLLSEGEISLPWNLRLLSLSGGGLGINNADSSDTSIKERDYSLSEGEIHPKIIHYLNMYQTCNSEEIDLQQDIYPTKLVTDSKIQYASSNDTENYTGRCNTFHKNLHLNISNSSLSDGEINSNASLSLGEVSPGFRASILESTFKSENYPSSKSSSNSDKLHCDSSTAASCSQTCGVSRLLLSSSFNEHGLHRGCIQEETDLQNPRVILQTVDEEVHSMFD